MLIDTVPTGLQTNIGIFSFGPMDAANTTFFAAHATSVAGFDFPGTSNLTSVLLPNLVSIDPLNIQGGLLSIQNCPAVAMLSVPKLSYIGGICILSPSNPAIAQALTSISLPSLVTVAGVNSTLGLSFGSTSLLSFSAPALATIIGNLSFSTNVTLTTLSFPSLTSIGSGSKAGSIIVGTTFLSSTLSMPVLGNVFGNISMISCPNLTTITVPGLIPKNGSNISISGAKLDAATVNLILARCVANAAYVSGTITLTGGTNAAPSGQGMADKATLIGRGVTVNTN